MTQNALNNEASIFTVDNLQLDNNSLISLDTNGDIILGPNGTGGVVPPTDRVNSLGNATNNWDNVFADGITFDDGTNILGTFIRSSIFTPRLAFGGASTGIVQSTSNGIIMRIGNLIFMSIEIILTSKGSASGDASIEDIPVQSEVNALFPIRWWDISLPAQRTIITGTIDTGTSSMLLKFSGNNVAITAVNDSQFANTSRVFLTGTYLANV